DGSYTLNDIEPGTYDLTAKASNSLRAKQSDVTVVAEEQTPDIDFSLLGGDANGDNSVGTGDMLILKAAWFSNPESPNWDERADFNGDGSIGTGDMLIMHSNWLTSGEE
ncbi:MAG: dockerin type I domain-containing protein, partial [Candidatus Omnitrophota bacterium]|nr:dockerin type I domain-containing protein [Candidatus Omnitrophota bacterium]